MDEGKELIMYMRDYSAQFPATRDVRTRAQKAEKILHALLKGFDRQNLQDLRCIDIGASIGTISDRIASAGAQVIAIDLDMNALHDGLDTTVHVWAWVNGDVERTPFRSESFDIIICSQVYEHTPNPERMVKEIHRLLTPTGICFFSGPNRWAMIEKHYNIPFLSWFPESTASRILRLLRRADSYQERPLSYANLQEILRSFEIHDLLPDLLSDPRAFGMKGFILLMAPMIRYLPSWGWSILTRIVPNFNWLLTK
ncbi:MAG: class I SAM-dependent methyltransferase [Candidatus Thorarchaeota archaeon]